MVVRELGGGRQRDEAPLVKPRWFSAFAGKGGGTRSQKGALDAAMFRKNLRVTVLERRADGTLESRTPGMTCYIRIAKTCSCATASSPSQG